MLNISILLTELGAEAEVILAGMFCDVSRKGVVSLEQLKSELPDAVYDIVVKTQLGNDELSAASEEVILIKLAERLHNMRTIEYIDESQRKKKVKETLELFIPLAGKLENEKLSNELNNLVMKYY